MDVKEKLDENGSPMYIVTTDKKNTEYYVQKSNDGFVFYTIKQKAGSVPKKLGGFYTTQTQALKALTEHLRTAPVSKTVERDRKYAAKSAAKNNEHIQQGASD